MLSQPNTLTLVLRLLLAAFFLFMAGKNLTGDASMAADFERWGFPDGFRVFTALLQIVGALLLLASATTFPGSLLLLVVLLGAVGTHLVHDPPSSLLSPLLALLVLAPVLLAHRPLSLPS
ncbi:MAG: hypothetical protein DHS20C15_23850 [Planctomycetota bacterium]|nr:MAG: hypothetical protein DHS20C15_23850 [Planctomycetota bacterium]